MVDDDEPQLSDEEGLIKLLLEQFEKYAKGGKKIPQEIVSSLSAIDSLSRLVDSIATQTSVDLADKQQLLETIPKRERVDAVLSLLEAEMDLQKVDSRIRSRVKEQMERSQKDYYLNEQIKAIQKEMGDDSVSEIDELSQKIQSSKMPKEAESKATAELKKLKNMARCRLRLRSLEVTSIGWWACHGVRRVGLGKIFIRHSKFWMKIIMDSRT